MSIDTPVAATPAPSISKAERTREALRQAAIRHFVEHGFEAANVPTIAAEVGVTERTFYRHFATKDEVLFVDVTTSLAWFRTGVRERLEAGDDLIAAALHAITAPPVDPRLMVEIARLRTQLLSPARIERSFRDAQGVMVRYLREVLAERGAAPLTAAVQAEVVAGAIFAALTVWTESPDARLGTLRSTTEQALEEIRPAL
ncbi:TetR/AcrR family transcriptional regulator [Nocardioides sp.]|uniref:TetR/AcrR family transcriptional regulator n=1 Tax=Nocardioides sp. TaxID=35761 RepID=UPI002B269322|nr:TetR/AcrR family transcriptional regulator [Nocardioides sp.]